ncbi:hypothetical protein GCM10023322_54210 [Rugosimonospora acidiphila]|uniref:Uncharacterized protein n=1 Tax=Rugosimonospora acidiphila TaxID=556531 RepID=A0ABP9SB59_9ACTN
MENTAYPTGEPEERERGGHGESSAGVAGASAAAPVAERCGMLESMSTEGGIRRESVRP